MGRRVSEPLLLHPSALIDDDHDTDVNAKIADHENQQEINNQHTRKLAELLVGVQDHTTKDWGTKGQGSTSGERAYVTASTQNHKLKPRAREGDSVCTQKVQDERTGEVTQEATDGTVISREVQDARTRNPFRKRRNGTSQDKAGNEARRVGERYRVLNGGYRVQSKNQ
uniref:Uncharacterized protein n=1 Tax=Capitella teleta TaxID=283909 RepID=X2AMG3_CAPTE